VTIALSVIAGLAIGIGFIVVFATIMPFSSTSNVIQKDHFISLTIRGLKATYNIGEAVNFSVTQKGGGCAFPDVWIENTMGNKVWSANSLSNALLCPSIEDKTQFEMEWTPGVASDYPRMNETGHYFVVAKFESDFVRQGFGVN
jgi:hypothetical protein